MSQVRVLLGEPFLFIYWGASSQFLGYRQVVKARDFDSRIAGSSPATPASFGSLAQLVEHLTFNQVVPGSTPG